MARGYLFSSKTGSLYHTEIHKNWPDDAVFVSEELAERIMNAPSRGLKVICEGTNLSLIPHVGDNTKHDLEVDELTWRNVELNKADVEINKIQDRHKGAVGTVSAWRLYRNQLRDWPEHPQFPNQDYRPKQPIGAAK